MIFRKRVLFLGVVLTLAASQAQAVTVFRTVRYYTVSGRTVGQLDRSLARNGPRLKTTGHRHPGEAEIRFDSKVHYGRAPGDRYCKIQNAYVNVHAKVFLPRWKQRRHAKPALALVWDTLLQDITRHEDSHVTIASSYASKLERSLRGLRSRRDCADLHADIDKTTARVLAAHDKAQLYFDRAESVNFESRFARLLTNRLEKMGSLPRP
ncbi:MAG: DUF922 domain-containing protein [Rhizobiales bacterium]|nr:DUF922 domain-containing protein [Hyphomicrobiales bacterium]OJX99183.1 MAG: peptidase [Rhizobiales bacterium 63-22]